jgi:hypothetical protein
MFIDVITASLMASFRKTSFVDVDRPESRRVAGRVRHGHVGVEDEAELDDPEEDEKERRQDERKLDEALTSLASCPGARPTP